MHRHRPIDASTEAIVTHVAWQDFLRQARAPNTLAGDALSPARAPRTRLRYQKCVFLHYYSGYVYCTIMCLNKTAKVCGSVGFRPQWRSQSVRLRDEEAIVVEDPKENKDEADREHTELKHHVLGVRHRVEVVKVCGEPALLEQPAARAAAAWGRR